MHSLYEKKLGDLFQDFCIGESFAGVVKPRCVDYGEVDTSGIVSESNRMDLTSLRIETVADLHIAVPGQ